MSLSSSPGQPSSASGGGRGARGARSRATARPGPGALEPEEGEEEEEEQEKKEAAASSCLILPGSADPLATAGWGWPRGAGPGSRCTCPRQPLARCARSRVVSGRRPGAPHAPRGGSAGGPATMETQAVGRSPGLSQSRAHQQGRRKGLAASGSLQGRGTPAAAIAKVKSS